VNDDELRERLGELQDLPLDRHPAAFEAVQQHIESELEELRRRLPGASGPRETAAAPNGR
jgi:hypothetical protein